MRTRVQSELPTTYTEECAVVVLPAEVDIANAVTVREQILWLLNSGVSAVVVDLSGTRLLTSDGMNAIARAYVRARAMRVPVRVVLPGGMVAKAFDVAGLSRVIPVSPSIAEARAALRNVPASAGGRFRHVAR